MPPARGHPWALSAGYIRETLDAKTEVADAAEISGCRQEKARQKKKEKQKYRGSFYILKDKVFVKGWPIAYFFIIN